MHHERLLVIAVAFAVGCGGAGYADVNNGVRQRIVSTVPTAQIAILPATPPRPGHVRIGVGGGVPFEPAEKPARSDEGTRFEPAAYGEGYIAVGMPGKYQALNNTTTTAGWELVAGVIGAPAPSSRALSSDPSLTVADQGILGASLGVTGAIGDRDVVLAGSFTVRDMALPFAWDYGDCAGGYECPVWTSKGAPEQGVEHALGVGGSIGFHKRMQTGLAWVFNGGFDVRPMFDATARSSVLCDANGNCSGGKMPEAPEVSHAGVVYAAIGIDAEPNKYSRVYVLAVPSTNGDGDRHFQLRAGMEARF